MSSLDLQAKIVALNLNPKILEYNDQAVVLMDPDKPTWLKTSSTGKWLFEEIVKNHYNTTELIHVTAEKYSLPETAVKSSIINLVENLIEDGLISITGEIKSASNNIVENNLYSDELADIGLISVWFNLLSQCNLKCSHCFLPEGENSNPISLDNAKKIIDILAEKDVKRLYFSGGEPLLYKHLLEIIEYAHEKIDWKIFIITNGFTDDFDLISKLTKYVDYFQVSLDGIDAKTHNKIRGDNSFEKAVKTISVINEANNKAKSSIAFTPLPENIDQMSKLLTFGIKLKTDAVFVTKPKKPARYNSNDTSFKEFLSEKFINKVMDQYDQMVSSYLQITKDTATFKGVKVPDLDSSFDPALNLLLNIKRGCCSAAGNTLFISEDGECYPCTALNSPEYSLGNILKDSFEKIYNENGVCGFRQKIHFMNIDDCSKCEFKYYCAGDCRALSNDVTDKSPYCNLIKERYNRLLKGVQAQK